MSTRHTVYTVDHCQAKPRVTSGDVADILRMKIARRGANATTKTECHVIDVEDDSG